MSAPDRTELLQGTLDLLVLKTLAALGPLHGFGIARRIEQVSGDTVLLNQGTIYPALVRLEDQGWIGSEWGVSENNRRARFYAITAAGRKQLKEEVAHWQRVAALVNAVLATG
jgi:transcriptional regulator